MRVSSASASAWLWPALLQITDFRPLLAVTLFNTFVKLLKLSLQGSETALALVWLSSWCEEALPPTGLCQVNKNTEVSESKVQD